MTSTQEFWAKVQSPAGECWPWTGRTDDRGYGRTRFAGRPNVELMLQMRRAGATQQAIADATGVSRGHVSKVLRGQTAASRKVA